MKINKHGKKHEESKKEEFRCDNCGCEFAVKPDEYYIDYGARVAYGPKDCTTYELHTNYTVTVSTTMKDVYVCSCPECHKIVKKEKEHANSNITVGGINNGIALDLHNGEPTNCDNTYSLTK